MKVVDGSNAPGADDLFERMKEAHRQERTESVSSPSGGAAADKVVELASLQSFGGDIVGDDLEARLLETAASALDGKFDTEAALRDEVIEVIIEQRYADQLSSGDADQITRTLEATLGQDPVFRKEVDNMLIQAARRLGQRKDR